MTKKQIILLVSMLVIFVGAMIGIFIFRNMSASTEETTVDEHAYADNGTFTTTVETVEETYEVQSQGYVYNHTELLSDEQNATRTRMNELVYYDFVKVDHPNDTVVSAEILDSSNDEQVYIQFEFVDPDGVTVTDTAVVLYDMYVTHDFMRCVSLEYYESLE